MATINSKQVYEDGYLFDSQTEYEYYKILKAKREMGSILAFAIKPQYVLIPPFNYMGKQVKGVVYTPDFEYVDSNGKTIVVEIKGYPTPDFELRLKLWKYKNQDKEIQVLKYSKATGFMKVKDYKKERKRITKEKEVQKRFFSLLDLQDEINKLERNPRRNKTQEKMLAKRKAMLEEYERSKK